MKYVKLKRLVSSNLSLGIVFLIKSFYTGGINQLNDIVPSKNYIKSRKYNDNFKSQYLHTLMKYGIFN
jgi:hypothetical protein